MFAQLFGWTRKILCFPSQSHQGFIVVETMLAEASHSQVNASLPFQIIMLWYKSCNYAIRMALSNMEPNPGTHAWSFQTFLRSVIDCMEMFTFLLCLSVQALSWRAWWRVCEERLPPSLRWKDPLPRAEGISASQSLLMENGKRQKKQKNLLMASAIRVSCVQQKAF